MNNELMEYHVKPPCMVYGQEGIPFAFDYLGDPQFLNPLDHDVVLGRYCN